MPRTKECKAHIKAAGPADGLEVGQFRALVSVFGNQDSMGDVVAPGAFADVLAQWKASGDPIPVLWAHKWSDPFSHLGRVLEATETADGLEVLGQIDDLDTNPTAKHVHGLLTGRRVKQFSFAYDVGEGGWIETDDTDTYPWGEYYEIRRFSALYEVGPCLVGANQETALLAAKAADLARGVKEGRVLAQAHYERLTAAHAAIGEVLAAAEPAKARHTPKTSAPPAAPAAGAATPEQQTGQPPADPTAATEPVPAKSTAPTPAQVAAWADITNLTMESAS
ncbi:HK97 family phage prohead protease [Actinacidiphila epipremni]|uniref:HK97 family phage prohead protease n=1 Tax=Actinacidiphila epipremni TaxID=2053013 RepID=A0ABX0ZKV2_9ACTN|nr:HK97 family phage prohead protease [Actinacidiphila epipremni]NJP42278.1 HK97 family phage prohead protease [Actinacidiphila epipremni]